MADFSYTTETAFIVTSESVFNPHFSYGTATDFVVASETVPVWHISYSGPTIFNVGAPDDEFAVAVSAFPFEFSPSVRIDGTDYTSVLYGNLNVSLGDNSAGEFSFNISSQREAIEFLKSGVEISFQAADEHGVVKNVVDIINGQVRNVAEGEDGDYELSGYDFGGVHGTRGELVSKDITIVLKGTIEITGPGTYDTGHSPIWGVVYIGSEDEGVIQDGRDYFVSPSDGIIEVPLSSNFEGRTGILEYSYAVYFSTLSDLIQAVADLKGWDLEVDGNLVLEDYTAVEKQPVLTISNESVLDVCRNLLEVSGAKVDTSLYPLLRVYSEYFNFFKSVKHVVDEDVDFEEPLIFEHSLDELITEQSVRSVAKVWPEVDISALEEVADESGSAAFGLVALINYAPGLKDSQYEKAFQILQSLEPKPVAEVKVSKTDINSVSLQVSGNFYEVINLVKLNLGVITAVDWKQSTVEGDLVFELISVPQMMDNGNSFRVFYPGADWGLKVLAQKIGYNESTSAANVEVKQTRPVTGITTPLVGDTHENAYIETAGQAENVANAILLQAGNISTVPFSMPLYKAAGYRIGDKAVIMRDGKVVFTGSVKGLSYDVDLGSGDAAVGVELKGVRYRV